MPFKKGNKLAKGGERPNCGRPSDWLRERCVALISKHKLIEFLADVASGEYTETIELASGIKTQQKKSAEPKERMKAIEILLDRGFGKAPQSIEHSGNIQSGNLVVVLPGNPKKASS